MNLEPHNVDLDIPNQNIVIVKDIDDILDDLNLSSTEREIYKDVITDLEQTMHEGFLDGLCVSIPYVARIIKNVGRRNILYNKKHLFGNNKEKGAFINKLYKKHFEDIIAKKKEKREADNKRKLEEKKEKVMRKKSKFKFNIGIETKHEVANYIFRKNYVKPGTFKYVNRNGKSND